MIVLADTIRRIAWLYGKDPFKNLPEEFEKIDDQIDSLVHGIKLFGKGKLDKKNVIQDVEGLENKLKELRQVVEALPVPMENF